MEKQLSQADILNFLRAKRAFLYDRFGVLQIGLFGSFATGKQTEESDIDILIELKQPRYEYVAGLQIFLERYFNRKIEIVRKSNNIQSRLIENIADSVIYA